MRCAAPFLALVLLAGCGEEGPDPEIARLRGELERVKRDFADFRQQKEREIRQMQDELAAKEKAGDLAAKAAEIQGRFDEYRARVEGELGTLQESLAAKAREAGEAVARVAELSKMKDGLAKQLADTKGLLDARGAELDAVKAELEKLKKIFGR